MSTTLRLRTFAFALAIAASGALVAACSGDDTDTTPPGSDSGVDGSKGDSGPNPGTDAGNDGVAPTTDGGGDSSPDGGTIDFSVFVKDLIDNHTNATESPKAIPPDNQLTDNQDPKDYPASYFP